PFSKGEKGQTAETHSVSRILRERPGALTRLETIAQDFHPTRPWFSKSVPASRFLSGIFLHAKAPAQYRVATAFRLVAIAFLLAGQRSILNSKSSFLNPHSSILRCLARRYRCPASRYGSQAACYGSQAACYGSRAARYGSRAACYGSLAQRCESRPPVSGRSAPRP